MSEKRNLLCARECAVLFQDAARVAVVDGVSNKPTCSTAIAHALDRLEEFERSGGAVLRPALMSLDPDRFNIPLSFPCGERYEITVSGSALVARFDSLRDRLSAQTPSIRPMYLNYVIRYVLRAGYALSHEKEFRDVLIVAGTDAEDNPAAFDPSELLSGSASRAADPARKKHMTFARIDPSIFDQSDLFPNGKVDAEGYADASELF